MNILPFHIINLKNKETHICSNLEIGLKKQRKSGGFIPISFRFGERFPEPARTAGGTAPEGGHPARYSPPHSSRRPAAPRTERIFLGHRRSGQQRALKRAGPYSRRDEPSRDADRDAASRLLPSLLPDPTPETGGSSPSPQRRAGALQGEAEVRSEAAPRRTTPAAEPPALPGPAPPGPRPLLRSREAAGPPPPRPARGAPAEGTPPRASPRAAARCGAGRGRRDGEPDRFPRPPPGGGCEGRRPASRANTPGARQSGDRRCGTRMDTSGRLLSPPLPPNTLNALNN